MNLGLVGGLGPLATIHYYQELVKHSPGELLIVHADMDRVLGDVARGDSASLSAYLAGLIERLAKGGATLSAVTAITPHICIRELEKISPLPIVNVVEEVNREIVSRGYKTVALFGTRFVVESRMFGMLRDVDVIVPPQIEAIHNAYMQVVNGEASGRETLSRIAKQLPVDAIVLAGTDLSPVFGESNTDFVFVDCVREHIRGIRRELAAEAARH